MFAPFLASFAVGSGKCSRLIGKLNLFERTFHVGERWCAESLLRLDDIVCRELRRTLCPKNPSLGQTLEALVDRELEVRH